MIFKLSLKLDVSLGNILLGLAGCSVAVCAYKYCFTKKTDQINSRSHDVIRNDIKENSPVKSNVAHLVKYTLGSKGKVLSSIKASAVENDVKFRT